MAADFLVRYAAILVLTLFCICLSFCHTIPRTTQCEFHNETLCNETGSEGCNETMVCEDPEPEKKGVYCFVLWQNNTDGRPLIKMKGCFLNNAECPGHSRCAATSLKEGFMFCCCEGNLCNKEFSWEPTPPPPKQDTIPKEKPPNVLSPVLFTLLPVGLLCVAFVVLCWLYRHKKASYFNEVPTMDPHPMPPSPTTGFRRFS